MENFQPEFISAMQKLLADEGGYVKDPQDPGRETKYGISKRSYPNLDIVNLTHEQAAELYYRDWWLKFHFDRLCPAIAGKVFNLAVNLGADAAIRCLQRACRACGQPLNEDGIVGQLTVDVSFTVSTADAGRALLAALRSEAAGHYRLLASSHDYGERFIKGWLNRAYE